MLLDGKRADSKNYSDFGVGLTHRQKGQDFPFAWTQTQPKHHAAGSKSRRLSAFDQDRDVINTIGTEGHSAAKLHYRAAPMREESNDRYALYLCLRAKHGRYASMNIFEALPDAVVNSRTVQGC